jgi:hypothetical protein
VTARLTCFTSSSLRSVIHSEVDLTVTPAFIYPSPLERTYQTASTLSTTLQFHGIIPLCRGPLSYHTGLVVPSFCTCWRIVPHPIVVLVIKPSEASWWARMVLFQPVHGFADVHRSSEIPADFRETFNKYMVGYAQSNKRSRIVGCFIDFVIFVGIALIFPWLGNRASPMPATRLGRLTEEESAQLRNVGGCFACRKNRA